MLNYASIKLQYIRIHPTIGNRGLSAMDFCKPADVAMVYPVLKSESFASRFYVVASAAFLRRISWIYLYYSHAGTFSLV